jgi:hypothetical protein
VNRERKRLIAFQTKPEQIVFGLDSETVLARGVERHFSYWLWERFFSFCVLEQRRAGRVPYSFLLANACVRRKMSENAMRRSKATACML